MKAWTLGVVAAAALGIVGCEDRKTVDRGEARQEVREMDRSTGSAAERMEDRADKAGEKLKEGAADAGRDVKETGRELRGKNSVGDRIKDKAADAKD
jgi:predicted outer membrane lipoprotein